MNGKLGAALGGAKAALAKARKLDEALTRARADAEAASARIASARRALVEAQADSASGAPVSPEALERLRSDLAAAERDVSLRVGVEAELWRRGEAFEEPLAEVRDALARARDDAAAEARADLLAAVRRAAEPGFRRLAALRHAGAGAEPIATAGALAALLGLHFEAEPASPEAEAGEAIRAELAALEAALGALAECRRERFRREQLAKREGPRGA